MSVIYPPTTYASVLHLAAPQAARGKLEHWSQYRNPDVVSWAKKYVHEYPSLADVEDAIAKVQKRPLGGGSRESEEQAKLRLGDEWPLSFLFHRLRGEATRIPGPNEFWSYLQSSVPEDCYTPTLQSAEEQGFPMDVAIRSLRWRAMNAWMSFIREMHVIATLHEWGIPARFHPAADINFWVDFWVGNRLYMVQSGNSLLAQRDRENGKPERYFPCPPYVVHRLTVPRGDESKVWLVPEGQIEATLGALAPIE